MAKIEQLKLNNFPDMPILTIFYIFCLFWLLYILAFDYFIYTGYFDHVEYTGYFGNCIHFLYLPLKIVNAIRTELCESKVCVHRMDETIRFHSFFCFSFPLFAKHHRRSLLFSEEDEASMNYGCNQKWQRRRHTAKGSPPPGPQIYVLAVFFSWVVPNGLK